MPLAAIVVDNAIVDNVGGGGGGAAAAGVNLCHEQTFDSGRPRDLGRLEFTVMIVLIHCMVVGQRRLEDTATALTLMRCLFAHWTGRIRRCRRNRKSSHRCCCRQGWHFIGLLL